MSTTTTLTPSGAPADRPASLPDRQHTQPGPIVPVEPGRDTRARRARRALGAAVHVGCWFYLSVMAFLLGWIAVVWAVMGWSPTVVSSGSMQPAISPGDVVMTAEPDPDLVFDEGTVVTFADPARPGELLTHRIVSQNEDGTYRTRGDGNRVGDSTDLDPEDVVGVGRLLVPVVGLPRVWLDQGRLAPFGAWVTLSLLSVWGAVRVLGDDEEPEAADDVAS